MGAFNQLNGAIFDAGAIEARLSAIDGKSIYNQRDGGILDFDSLARRLTALDGKVAVGQGGIEFDVDTFMRRLAAIEAGGLVSPSSLGLALSWFDPVDFATEYQESSALTPVSATTQTVGFLGDKGTGAIYGPELVTNGTFDSGTTTGWTPNESSLAVVGGQLQLTTAGVGGFNTSCSQSVTTVVGANYTARGRSAKVTCVNSLNMQIGASTIGSNATTTPTDAAVTYVGVGASALVRLAVAGNETGTTALFDNISVKAWTGNHLTQTTAGSRPIEQSLVGGLCTKSDGLDDFLAATTGGGGSAGFFYCAAINPSALGANQTLWADTGTNTGYRVRLNASNQLELAAGNGTVFTTAATVAAVTSGTTYVVMAWHDGVNLNVQINSGTVGTTAFGTTTAGTASFTDGASNGGASGFFNGYLFNRVYMKDSTLTAAQRTQIQQYVASKAGVTL